MKGSAARVHVEQMRPMEQAGVRPDESRYRWVMLGLVWLLYTAFGVVSRSLAPLVTPILRDLDISYSQMGLVIGSWPLVYIVVAAVCGAVIDRWGIRKALFLGILVVGLSEVLRYFASGFVTMFLFVALFGLGGPMISVGCPKTIAEWFRGKERGTAVGICTTGPRMGGFIALSTANSVVMPLTGYSWRLTFVLYGLLALAAAALWWSLAKDTKAAGVKENSGTIQVFRALTGIRNVQLILTMGFLSFSVTHGFGDWLPRILEVGGLPPALAGYAASIPIAVGVPAALLIPRLVAPRSRGRIAALLALSMTVSVLTAATTSGALLVLALIVWGLASTCITPLLMLIMMDIPQVGIRYMGSASGMYFSVAEIGGFAGPFMIGVATDLTGSFLTGTAIAAGLALAVAAMALQLRPGPPEAMAPALPHRGL